MSTSAIIGLAGLSLSPDERALLAAHRPLGVMLFRRNVQDPAQVIALAAEIRNIVPGAIVAVDQEGGRVARLRPPHWLRHPPAAQIGALHARAPELGERAAFLTGLLIGLECAASGFDLVAAPMLDLSVDGASDVVGDRAFSSDPASVAVLGAAMAEGLLSAGVQPIGKHAPGHGRAGVDSHLSLPVLDEPREPDLLPFRENRWLPWMMTAHIRFDRLDPERAATVSPVLVREVIRTRIGFEGVLVSDDLAMEALSGDAGTRTRAARAAGCDVALHCSGVLAESRQVLEAAGEPDAASLARLERARAMAASGGRRGRFPGSDGLDGLVAERERLLAHG